MSLSSQSPADKYDLINKTSRVSPDSGRFYEPDTVLDHRERVRLFIQIQFPHGSDWSEVLRLTDIVTEKVSSSLFDIDEEIRERRIITIRRLKDDNERKS